MYALEDLGEGFALLEVQAVVVVGARGGIAPDPLRIEVGDEIRVRTAYGPAGPHRQCGVEAAFDFANAEVLGEYG
ncbi:hypothetical protein D9M73_297330 [compost metagenome]